MAPKRIWSKKLPIALLIVLVFAMSAYWAVPQTLAFCVLPINPWENVAGYTVYVASSQQGRYKAEITKFLRDRGVYTLSGEMLTFDPGGSKSYDSIQTLGCNGSVSVWSQNSVHPGEFLVTIHKNALFGTQQAAALSRDFVSAFGKQFKVLNTTDYRALDAERNRLRDHQP